MKYSAKQMELENILLTEINKKEWDEYGMNPLTKYT